MNARPPAIDVDGARVAGLPGLEVGEFRTLMAHGKIATLCERGTGDVAGEARILRAFERGTPRDESPRSASRSPNASVSTGAAAGAGAATMVAAHAKECP